jgi:hypothetical protein
MQIKIQCPCGAKHALDITPEQAAGGVRFICEACGIDRSEAVNQVIQEQLDLSRHAARGGKPPPASEAELSPLQSQPQPLGPSSEPAGQGSQAAMTEMPAVCLKHPGRFVVAECPVCHNPLCPVCMEEFGPVCSAACRRRAKAEGIPLPAQVGQPAAAAGQFRRLIGWVILGVMALGLVALGVLGWYWLVGSKPRLVLSLKLRAAGAAGWAQFTEPGQVIYWTGRELTRLDVDGKHQVWSITWSDLPERNPGRAGTGQASSGGVPASGTPQVGQAGQPFWVQIHGRDIWVVAARSVVCLDWSSGRTNREIPLPGRLVTVQPSDTALVLIATRRSDQSTLMRIDLSSGLAETLDLGRQPLGTVEPSAWPGARRPRAGAPARTPFGRAVRGAESIRDLNEARNRAIEEALDEPEAHSATQPPSQPEPWRTQWINAEANVAELSVRRTDNVLAAPSPASTTLVSRSAAAADLPRYQVALRRRFASAAPDWSGEVMGQPAFFSTATVDLLIAGRTVRAFDKRNKPLWEIALSQPVTADLLSRHTSRVLGQAPRGPCVQQGNALYLFDHNTLRAVDIMNGSIQWELALPGIRQVEPDQHGWLYVISYSATGLGPDQASSGDLTGPGQWWLWKLNPQNGKVLWRVADRGVRCYLTGQFLYTVNCDPTEPELAENLTYLTVWRVAPEDGHSLWEHSDPRLPLALDFQLNRFLVLFGEELQVWRFRTF